jgi:hypothetical protein
MELFVYKCLYFEKLQKTLSKVAWDQHPAFFEVGYSKFLEEGKKSGDIVDSSFIPQPKTTDPTHIRAIGSNSGN